MLGKISAWWFLRLAWNEVCPCRNSWPVGCNFIIVLVVFCALHYSVALHCPSSMLALRNCLFGSAAQSLVKSGRKLSNFCCFACVGAVRCCEGICSRCARPLRVGTLGFLDIVCCHSCMMAMSFCGSLMVCVRACASCGLGGFLCCGGMLFGSYGLVPVCGDACGNLEEQEDLALQSGDGSNTDADEEIDESLRRPINPSAAQFATSSHVYGAIHRQALDFEQPLSAESMDSDTFDDDRDRISVAWRRAIQGKDRWSGGTSVAAAPLN